MNRLVSDIFEYLSRKTPTDVFGRHCGLVTWGIGGFIVYRSSVLCIDAWKFSCWDHFCFDLGFCGRQRRDLGFFLITPPMQKMFFGSDRGGYGSAQECKDRESGAFGSEVGSNLGSDQTEICSMFRRSFVPRLSLRAGQNISFQIFR